MQCPISWLAVRPATKWFGELKELSQKMVYAYKNEQILIMSASVSVS